MSFSYVLHVELKKNLSLIFAILELYLLFFKKKLIVLESF